MKDNNKTNVVLIADDDAMVRKAIVSALKEINEVIFVEVSDGKDVEASYLKHQPDVIFLDIHLPSISGLCLINSLLKIDKDAHIIMVSADSTQTNVLNSIQKGTKGFLTKPFDRQRILDIFYACPTVMLGE